MVYQIRKLPNKDLYRVYNKNTKEVHSYATSLENAKKQVKLLHMIDAGVPLKKGTGIDYVELVRYALGIGIPAAAVFACANIRQLRQLIDRSARITPEQRRQNEIQAIIAMSRQFDRQNQNAIVPVDSEMSVSPEPPATPETSSYNENTVVPYTEPDIETGSGIKNIKNMNSKEIEEKIEQYLNVREEEKNKHGEVFTPIELIEEMFNKLPSSIWSNPELKWLDPANGIGNFPMVAYQRLMKGLEKWEPSEIKRNNHIIENMLYMVEINPKNVKISKKIFGSKANICCANFETQSDNCFKQFGIDNFDIIMGNPPFQDEIKEKDTMAPRKGGKNKLYERITIKCLSLLNKNGYLLFVTPDNIMTGNINKAYEEILKYNVLYISFNNIQKKYFSKIGQSMCYFLVENKHTSNNYTKIQSSDGTIFELILKDRSINPVNNWTSNTEKLIDMYLTNDQNGFIRTKDGVNTSNISNGAIKTIINDSKYFFTNNKDIEGYKIKKYILFRMQPSSQGVLDKTGNLGLSSQIYYLPLKQYNIAEIKAIDNFFKSNIYNELQQITTTGQYLKDSFVKKININKIIY